MGVNGIVLFLQNLLIRALKVYDLKLAAVLLALFLT